MALDFSSFVSRSEELLHDSIGRIAVSGVVGYLAARVFTTLDPIQGLYFGLVCGVMSSVVDPIFTALLGEPKKSSTKLVGRVGILVIETGIAYGLMKGLGCSLSFKSTLGLIAAEIPVVIIGLAAFITLTGAAYLVYKSNFEVDMSRQLNV